MPRSGSGVYTLPSPAPFSNGTTIDAPGMNTVQTDIAAALTASTAADGQTPITGNWNFGGKNISNVASFSAATAVFSAMSTSGGVTIGNALTVTKGGIVVGAGGVTVGADGMSVTGGLLADVVAIGSGGPTWTAGAGVPVAVQPRGSIWSRTDGGVGTTLYVSQGAGTWNPVASV